MTRDVLPGPSLKKPSFSRTSRPVPDPSKQSYYSVLCKFMFVCVLPKGSNRRKLWAPPSCVLNVLRPELFSRLLAGLLRYTVCNVEMLSSVAPMVMRHVHSETRATAEVSCEDDGRRHHHHHHHYHDCDGDHYHSHGHDHFGSLDFRWGLC